MAQARLKPLRPAKAPKPAPAVREDTISSPDGVFNEILNGLYDGRYVPGQKLIESDLTDRFKVSRGSVREALKRLAAEGVVQLTLHRGAYIRTLSRKDVRDVMLLMEVMIGLTARLAAENIGAPGAAEAMKAVDERVHSARTGQTFADFAQERRARWSFYDTMVDIGGNGELRRLLPSMHLVRVQLRAYPMTDESVRLEYYRQITQAVLAGDAGLAEYLGRAQIRRFIDSIPDLPEEAFGPEGGAPA